MAPRDPTGDKEPDFLSEDWESIRDAIIAGGKTLEEAVEVIKQSWTTRHEKDMDAWNEYQQQQRATSAQPEDNRDNAPLDEDPPAWLNRPTPSHLDVQPARHILKKLEKKEFVELWHFTAQGCRNAASIDLAAPDDTFGLINTEKGLMLQTVGAASISSKVTKDENLSWELLSEGKTRLLNCMDSCGWTEHEVRELAKFYLNLDLHPIRSEDYGAQTVLRYQDRVRRDWIEKIRAGAPYAIGTINDNLMREYQRQIAMELQAKNNVSQLSTQVKKGS